MLKFMLGATVTEEPQVMDAKGLMAKLRGPASRPEVDPGLAGGLRDWLEDGLSEALGDLPEQVTEVRVTKEAVNQVLTCEAHLAARLASPAGLSFDLVRGTMVDALFRQWVTTGEVGDPLEDSLGALSAQGDRDDVSGFVEAMAPNRRAALANAVAAHVDTIRAQWPVMRPGWMARTQERLLVPLGGGSVMLSGVVDLALGSPSSGRSSVCVVEVKSGRRRVEHRGDVHLYALMETLRSSAPPFRVATYYSATGELDAEPVGEDVLVGALHRVLAATVRLCRMASGVEPAATPNGLCAWCVGLPACVPGQKRAGTAVPLTSGSAVSGAPDLVGEEGERWQSH